MGMPEELYYQIINFLLENTDYTYQELTEGRSEYQLRKMYERIKENLERYPVEIYNHLQFQPNFFHSYTLEELKSMNYNTLAKLRKSLGIRTQSKTEETSKNISSFDTQKEEHNITNYENSEELSEREPQILTPDEIAFMYKEEDYNKEELREKGIISDHIEEEKKDPEEERYIMIDMILASEFSLKGMPLEIEDLLMLDEDTLKALCKTINALKEKQENTKRL